MSRTPKSTASKRSKARRPVNGRPFDAAAYLETAANGRVISSFNKKDVIFEQGDAADSVVYIRSGKVKVTVYPSKATKRLSQSWAPMNL